MRYFALFLAQKKCAEGAHTPYSLATTSNHPQKASGTPAHFFFDQKRRQNGQKRPKIVQIRLILRYFALFLAHKSARRARTPRAHLQLPQTTPRKPQEPRRTFFSRPKTASKWPKTTKNRQNTPYFEIFRAIFSAQKCAEGAHAPCPLATTSNHPQKASETPAHFFFGTKMAKMTPSKCNPP